MSALRTFLRENIADIITVWDDHNPGVYDDGMHQCSPPCSGFYGPKDQWEQHLADKLADLLEEKATQLELFQ